MIHRLVPLTAALALCFALPAFAQTAAAPKPAAKVQKKPVAKRVAKAPAEVPPPAASDEQKAAAAIALVGDYACEFDQVVKVDNSAKYPGYLDVGFKTQNWVMKPVLSSTGALRLEDVKGRMLMIQIANKSMVMDSQIGQRLVDGCQHEKQREFARTMEPSTGLLAK